MAGRRETIFELKQYGQYIRVQVMDVASLTEITFVGAVGVPKKELQRRAYDKMQYVLRKKGIISE